MGYYRTLVGLLCWTMLLEAVSSTEVSIKIYPMQKADWTTFQANTLATSIVSEANSYCPTHLSDCNLSANTTFDTPLVTITNTAESSKSLSMSVSLGYPVGASLVDGTLTLVPASALEAILGDARDLYKDTSGNYVTYVGTEYYGIPPDATANKAIIPVAFLVVIAAAVVTIALVKWQSNKERQETLRARREKHQVKETVSGGTPTNTHYALETTNTTFASATTTPRGINNSNNQVSPDTYDPAAKPRMMHYGNFSVNEFVPEEKTGKNGLAPLPHNKNVVDGRMGEEEEDDEAARKEKKRKRKERRREKERMRQQHMEDSLEMYDNQGMDSSVLTESEAKIPTFKVES